MSKILDRDHHYNEGDTNESTERDSPDGSLRCPLFVQDTDEMIDEDGNLWVCWVNEEEWEEEQTARQRAVRVSRFFCMLAALTESSEDTPIVTDTLVGMPSETMATDVASVPSTGFLTAINPPFTEEEFLLQALLDPEPDNFIPVVSSGEEHPRPLSEIFFFGGYNYNAAVEDHHYNTEVEDEDDDEEESDGDDESNDESDDDSNDDSNDDSDDDSDDDSNDGLDSDTENEDRDDSEGGCNLHSEPGDNDESLNPDTVEATPSIPPNNTLAITSNQGPVEQFTDTIWDFIGNTLFTIGVCVWRIVPKKLKVKLKARCADYLASGAGSPSTIVEQEARSEEDKNQDTSENNVFVPYDGHGTDYLESLGCIQYPNETNYLNSVNPDYFNYQDYDDREDDGDGGDDGGGYNGGYEEDDNGDELVAELAAAWIADHDDRGAGGAAWIAYGDEEDEEDEEDEDEEELDQTLPARFYRIVTKAWDYLIENLGTEWALANRSTCYRYINRIWRRWVVHARINRGRENIWGEIPDLGEGEFGFVEKCPRDLRISKYSRRRYGGRFGGFRILLYRG
ncbi:hypothetical protein BHYA_0062g00310 [Botrytis hyacinthi]|uniref:Uncharacterized protein n=1 Tax=Botrytis hyacinthi TaxID=278943 RepID=A0A4Z1GRU1_9HELO|nr:hypothetical protein BHYA_0062g00310 [Botrytis hyacinthi]